MPDRNYQPYGSVPLIYLHVTETLWVPLILKQGLRTKKDRRGKGRIWLCDLDGLCWAARHVQETHHTSDLSVLQVILDPDLVCRQRDGIFWTKTDINPIHIRPFERINRFVSRILL